MGNIAIGIAFGIAIKIAIGIANRIESPFHQPRQDCHPRESGDLGVP
jgi:hypothetical protein